MKEFVNLHKILIIRLSAMGDILLATPLIRILRKRFPEAQIDVLVKEQFKTLLQFNPNVSQVIGFNPNKGSREKKRIVQDIKKIRYDAVLDLQRNTKSTAFRIRFKVDHVHKANLMRWQRFLLVYFNIRSYKKDQPVPLRYLESADSWDISDDGLGLDFYLDPKAKDKIQSLLSGHNMNGKPILVLAPGAGRVTKRWLPERFAEVGTYFRRCGFHIALVGGSGDKHVGELIQNSINGSVSNFIGRFSIQETAALIFEAACLITNDTGVMHIGAAFNTPLVAIFGPTTRDFGFFPFRAKASIIERKLSCRPCSFHGTSQCPVNHFLCMKSIQTDDVMNAVELLLEKENT
jgi:heptosyltransferase-2